MSEHGNVEPTSATERKVIGSLFLSLQISDKTMRKMAEAFERAAERVRKQFAELDIDEERELYDETWWTEAAEPPEWAPTADDEPWQPGHDPPGEFLAI